MSPAEAALGRSIELVAQKFGLSVAAVRDPQRQGPRRARQLALYLAVTGFDLPVRRVAPVAKVQRSTVQNALRRVEDARLEPAIDILVSDLEGALHA